MTTATKMHNQKKFLMLTIDWLITDCFTTQKGQFMPISGRETGSRI